MLLALMFAGCAALLYPEEFSIVVHNAPPETSLEGMGEEVHGEGTLELRVPASFDALGGSSLSRFTADDRYLHFSAPGHCSRWLYMPTKPVPWRLALELSESMLIAPYIANVLIARRRGLTTITREPRPLTWDLASEPCSRPDLHSDPEFTSVTVVGPKRLRIRAVDGITMEVSTSGTGDETSVSTRFRITGHDLGTLPLHLEVPNGATPYLVPMYGRRSDYSRGYPVPIRFAADGVPKTVHFKPQQKGWLIPGMFGLFAGTILVGVGASEDVSSPGLVVAGGASLALSGLAFWQVPARTRVEEGVYVPSDGPKDPPPELTELSAESTPPDAPTELAPTEPTRPAAPVDPNDPFGLED